jgi:glycosyltransferase involved in cell wall biosynthesis
MKSLVFVTQQADPEHPVLAATVAQIAALASRVDEVLVLANGPVIEGALPPNCRVRSFAARTKAARTARYLAALLPALARRPLALVAHMSPVYAVLAAPLARPLRVPVLLWFTQARGGRLLRVAEPLVSAILTVDPRSVPLDSPKVRAIGHGIDVTRFPCRTAPSNTVLHGRKLRLLGLGRYAPVKGWDVALRALAQLPDAELAIHGPALTDADRRNRAELELLARELGLDGRVTFGVEVPRSEVPRLLAQADAVVNPTRGSAADKVVFEAAAACVPVLAASPVFDGFLPPELRFHGPEELAQRLRTLDPAVGPTLRARVVAGHSAEHWADAVLEVAGR